ncbi:ATP-binding cassette domain-containing protein [Salinispirillum sp. LH 10-3-1]|uniref:ATP-binding cassette domain-containing protein n=1 Tax=Salinispirillum sp. LH 10-3-1 TaxID=2952525 RepID=A0AB38YD94_9GAMM
MLENNGLEVKGLELQRGQQRWHYDFAVKRGDALALMGPSGVGKTSLLECLSGFVSAQAGEVLLDGTLISTLSAEQRPASTLFQQHNLFEHLSVAQNIRLGFRQGRPDAIQWGRVMDACRQLGVADLLTRAPGELSGGQRQRIALIRTVLREQPLILLDEPYSALDEESRLRAGEWVRQHIKATQKVLVFVTHMAADAERWADDVLQLQSPVTTTS